MKIALLYSLLIYQLLPHCDATAAVCTSWSNLMEGLTEASQATYVLNRGHNWEFTLQEDCNDPNNSSYVLLQQNHHTGELDVVSQHQYNKFTVSDVQLRTSGIYCMYKQCAQDRREQCCVRIIVTPEVEIIFPSLVHNNGQEYGVCYVKAWPLLTATVFTNDDRCVIAKRPLKTIDIYTTAIFFTLDNIISFCLSITCSTQLEEEEKNITISPIPTTTTSTSTSTDSPSPTTGSTSSVTLATTGMPATTGTPGTTPTPSVIGCTSSGVLGIYRITLWIIVLTLTILSTAITSLVPNFL